MTIITNADKDLRIDPMHRPGMEAELVRQGQHQEIVAEGKRNARNRVHKAHVLLPGADAPLNIEGRVVEDTLPEFMLDEPEYDETIPTLMPYVARWVHRAWWPFKARGAVFGMVPCLGPKAWEQIIDVGAYCLRCLSRHAEAHPDECASCGLGADHRERALDAMEQARQMHMQSAPNRAQRRAMQRGLVLPRGVG